MMLFRKRTRAEEETVGAPERCHVCSKRMGTAQIMVPTAHNTPKVGDDSRRWICSVCLDDLRRSASTN